MTSPRPRRTTIPSAVAAGVGVAAVLAGCALQNPDAPPTPTRTTATASTPPVASVTAAQIDRQDHPPAALVHSQQAAASARPMLPALPISTAGVAIEVGGLAANGRTTILTITSPHGGRRHALAVYRHELQVYGDTGRAYQPEVHW